MTARSAGPWSVPGLPWEPLERLLERLGCRTVTAMAARLGVERCTVCRPCVAARALRKRRAARLRRERAKAAA